MTTEEQQAGPGIDHLAVYSPPQCLPLLDLAEARGVDPNKYLIGLGLQQISVPGAREDSVSMAATAGRKVLEEAGVSPDDVGLLIVGTETPVDKSKPVATHVHDLLGIDSRCRVYDIVHACIGGTYGVTTALDWLCRNDRYALVIASDIALYEAGTLAEPTQGAGAVAMLFSNRPRLLHLEELNNYSTHVYDFWKPMDSEYPVVDGVYSGQCYIQAALHCYNDIEVSPRAAFAYHTPFPKLVRHAHDKVAQFIEGVEDSAAHFERHVAPSIEYPSRIGNIYTASLWLALAGIFGVHHKTSDQDIREVYDGCYLFSYGSGCGAELLRGRFTDETSAWSKQLEMSGRIESRRHLSVAEYEALRSPNVADADEAYAPGTFYLKDITENKRTYVCSQG
ncbi:MAG: hydroxymethylglutaryl-CoA synthase [Verrucomicrobiota bacterium]